MPAVVITGAAGVPLRTVNAPLPPDDPTRRRPDIRLAVELLGWQPKTPPAEGLQSTLRAMRLRRTQAGAPIT